MLLSKNMTANPESRCLGILWKSCIRLTCFLFIFVVSPYSQGTAQTNTPLSTGQISQEVAKAVSWNLYSFEYTKLQSDIEPVLNAYDRIRGVVVIDGSSKKEVFSFHQSEAGRVYNQALPEDFSTLTKNTSPVIHENEIIGSVIVYIVDPRQTKDSPSVLKSSASVDDGQIVANRIADFAAKAIFNLDEDQLRAVLEGYLAEHEEIEGLEVFETLENEKLLSYHRDAQGQPDFGGAIPQDIKQSEKYSAVSFYEGESIGRIEVYIRQRSILGLTPEEEAWLKANPSVSVGIEDWHPFISMETNGEPGGIVGDFIRVVQEKTGLKFAFISDIWVNLLNDFKEGKIDLLPATYYTEERAKYGLYSNPYFTGKEFLYVRNDNQEVKSFKDLKGKKLAIPKDFGTIAVVKGRFPEIEIVETKDQLDSIYSVINGAVDATYETQFVMDDVLRRELITGVRAIAQTEFAASSLYFFSHKEKPLLQSILTKALDSISEEEKRKIMGKWVQAESASIIGEGHQEQRTQDSALLSAPVILAMGIGLLILLSITVFLLGKMRSDKDLSSFFGAASFRVSVLIGLSVLVLGVALMNWVSIADSKKRALTALEKELRLVLKSSIERLNSWEQERKEFITQVGRDPELVQITNEVLALKRDRTALLSSEALEKARAFFASHKQFGSGGFFIIAPDRVSVGSRRDENIGIRNFIADVRPDLIDRAFDGEAVFIPPIRSDVELGQGEDKPLSMFFAAPITNARGEVIAVMTERIRPSGALSKILHHGRIGLSGETYAFNHEGKMVSQSRFRDQLQEIGLLPKQGAERHEFEIRDPGRNLTTTNGKRVDSHSSQFTLMLQNALQMRETLATDFGMNTEGYRDYRGVTVVGVWSWHHNLDIGVTTEINLGEAMENHHAFRFNMLVVSVIATTMAVSATLFTLILGQRSHRSLSRARDELEDRVIERTRELSDSEKRIRSIIENATDGIISINETGAILGFSPAAEAIFGYTAEEVIGKNIKMLMPEPMRSEHDGYLARYHKDGIARVVGHNREVVGLRKDGSEFPMDLAVGEAILEEEHVFTGMVRDITDRRIAEVNLKFYQFVVEQAVESVFWLRTSDLGVHYVNNTACQRLGYSRKELLEMTIPDFDPDFSRERLSELLQALKQGTLSNVLRRHLTKTGEVLEMEVSLYLADHEGEELLVANANDVTQRLTAERQLADAYAVISSSINYASNIQRSILPARKSFPAVVEDHFIIWEPRDKVGGDIYWCCPWGLGHLIICADCTGHGVPGAFMTLIASAALDRAQETIVPGRVGQLIARMHQLTQLALKQNEETGLSDDGLELGACFVDPEQSRLVFSGARFSLFLSDNEGLTELKGDKSGIGYRGIPLDQRFTDHELDLLPGIQYYLSSDGLIDQIGGERRRMFGKKRFKSLLTDIKDLPMSEQKDRIQQSFEKYRDTENRRDDVTVIGFRVH